MMGLSLGSREELTAQWGHNTSNHQSWLIKSATPCSFLLSHIEDCEAICNSSSVIISPLVPRLLCQVQLRGQWMEMEMDRAYANPSESSSPWQESHSGKCKGMKMRHSSRLTVFRGHPEQNGRGGVTVPVC